MALAPTTPSADPYASNRTTGGFAVIDEASNHAVRDGVML